MPRIRKVRPMTRNVLRPLSRRPIKAVPMVIKTMAGRRVGLMARNLLRRAKAKESGDVLCQLERQVNKSMLYFCECAMTAGAFRGPSAMIGDGEDGRSTDRTRENLLNGARRSPRLAKR